jgi:hypothetical protein
VGGAVSAVESEGGAVLGSVVGAAVGSLTGGVPGDVVADGAASLALALTGVVLSDAALSDAVPDAVTADTVPLAGGGEALGDATVVRVEPLDAARTPVRVGAMDALTAAAAGS